MSRRLLLATGHSPATPPPPIEPPVDPGPPDAWTTALTPVWQNVVRVGPTRTHTTINTAWEAVSADGGGFAAPYGGYYGGGIFKGAPRIARYRSAIILDPGTYTILGDRLDSPGGIDIVGATGDPTDVTIIGGLGGDSPGYVANIWDDFYCAHVTLRIPDQISDAGKSYAIHMTWHTLENSPTTNIFENVIVDDLEATRPGGPLGWDAADNSLLYAKDCTFNGARSMVLHGDATPTGVQIAFESCNFNIPAIPGESIISNCTLNGSPVPDSGSIPAITNGSHRPGRYTPSTSTVGPVTLRPLASTPDDLGPVALSAGHVYYVPIPITAAGRIGQVVASLTTTAGTVALGLYSETGGGGFPGDLGGIYGTPVAATSAPTKGLNPESNWPVGYVTRDHTMWAAILVTDTTAQVLGSTTLSSSVTCYRSMTVQSEMTAFMPEAEALAPGTAVPWLGLTLA